MKKTLKKVDPNNLEYHIIRFVEKLNGELKTHHYKKNKSRYKYQPVSISTGKRYYKLMKENDAWAFVSRYTGTYKGEDIKVGDFLRAQTYSTPAKHSRGNIIDGTAAYSRYGALSLK